VGFAAEDFTELQWIIARDNAPLRLLNAGFRRGLWRGFGHGMNGLVKRVIGEAERPGGDRAQA
jgi:hypothetical protein